MQLIKKYIPNQGDDKPSSVETLRVAIIDQLGHNEVKELSFWKAILGEILATILYIFIVCGSGMNSLLSIRTSNFDPYSRPIFPNSKYIIKMLFLCSFEPLKSGLRRDISK